MTSPTPYIHLAGNAREALDFYRRVFECEVQIHTFKEFGRTDGPADAVAHGYLLNGPVSLYFADVAGDEPSLKCEGLMFSLLGVSTPTTLTAWFTRLSEDGHVVDDLQVRPWGASDGRVVDRFGLHWLIGFETSE